ncbi:hypothetical protein TPHA_0D02070 [Tetrapisispora phaffii CBS 4417]|uniref:Central kinetochore subunit MCM21 n=1 Tax=Tetrapisispora phaffii (strain ATCC 24235 / CBS 4417 / NBRC 1672 / NRRL Y-8282 / UCD 70-5) TaxID=1071381 RepID=G8BSM4_TETPH|nr:hypothetical protein TPHA_0D02070 [Tetrapisispora phaffii CBS 4417]CCE62845.1 hypothetical protein TPHA_0D02070 [Tetrapisispora phaffii CBS 4417]
MSTLDNLRQDIDALRKELEYLNTKKKALENEVNNAIVNDKEEEPLLQEFNVLFNQFPDLFELLSKEKIKRSEMLGKHHRDEVFGTEEEANKRKQSEHLNDDDNMPEHEWILNKQPIIEHKIFASELSENINTDILTSPSKRKKVIEGIEITGNDANMGYKNPNLNEELERKIIKENTFRLFGISYFPVVDPCDLVHDKSNNEVNNKREMIGIRLEVFDDTLGVFEKPHYILLKKKTKSNNWGLFKYTIPNYIDIYLIFQRINNGILLTYEDIYIFAKQVYIQLLLIQNRKKNLMQLQEANIVSDILIDLNLKLIKMNIINTTTKLTLYLEKDKVTSVSIYSETLDIHSQKRWKLTLLGPVSGISRKIRYLSQM